MKHQKENVEDLSQCRVRSEIAWHASPHVDLRWSPILVKMRCQLDAFVISQPFYSNERIDRGKKNLLVSSLKEIMEKPLSKEEKPHRSKYQARWEKMYMVNNNKRFTHIQENKNSEYHEKNTEKPTIWYSKPFFVVQNPFGNKCFTAQTEKTF